MFLPENGVFQGLLARKWSSRIVARNHRYGQAKRKIGFQELPARNFVPGIVARKGIAARSFVPENDLPGASCQGVAARTFVPENGLPGASCQGIVARNFLPENGLPGIASQKTTLHFAMEPTRDMVELLKANGRTNCLCQCLRNPLFSHPSETPDNDSIPPVNTNY